LSKNEGEIFMLLKGFYDGGNEANSQQYDYVTLAAFFGRPSEWKPFDRAWSKGLEGNGAEYLHTTDLMTFNGIYETGWDMKRRTIFLNECADLIGQSVLLPDETGDPVPGLVPYSVTIALKDFKRIQVEFPDGPHDATDGLAVQALSEIIEFCRLIRADFVHMIFDRNEPYVGHVRDRINNRKFVKQIQEQGFDIGRKITSVTESDSRGVIGLQAADLLAWCITRKHSIEHDWHEKIVSMQRREEWLDYERLKDFRHDALELARLTKLPRRRATP
jgi:hypothetical protein